MRGECRPQGRGQDARATHLHPMQLRIIVGFGKAGKHKVIRILEERARAKACWSEHGRVQRARRLVGVRMRVRWLLLVLLGWGRWGRGWKVFSGLVNDAQLDNGRRVDWTAIGCSFREWETRKKRKKGKKGPPTPHILACLGCCLTWSS